MHVPYTYLIGWSKHRKFHYGVRYALGCHPNDLFVEYFTSSDVVKKPIITHDNPDIIQIRRTFDDVKKARDWESIVLKKMNVVKRSDFLNRTDRYAPPIITSEILQGTYVTAKGDDRTDKQKLGSYKQSKKMKGRISKRRKTIRILGIDYESVNAAMSTLNISTSLIYFIRDNDISSCDTIEDIKKLSWFRRSEKLSLHKHSDETRKKISNSSKGKKGTRNGVTVTQITRERLSNSIKGKKSVRITCPHCQVEGGANTMKRWHFSNCKIVKQFTAGC